MDWINFIKPSTGKIILFVLLFSFFSSFIGNPYFFALCDPCGCYDTWGFPLPFAQETAQGANMEEFDCGTKVTNWNIPVLLIDIILWYLISVLVIFAFQKIRKKRSPF